MSAINFGTSVSLKEAAQLIVSNPDIRFMLRGEPGIGKSSLEVMIKRLLPHYLFSYIDAQCMDLGDIAMPVMDHEAKVTRYYPNARFGMHLGQPVCIMIDEFAKGMQPVQNMLHPLLERTHPRLGDMPSPKGTIVFLTSNLSSDGVGDNIKAHTKNRVTTLHVRKPDAEEWMEWAVQNDIDPSVIVWVKNYPHALASYLDGDQGENPYIFQPKKMQEAFVSPRSLAAASHIVANRKHYNESSLVAALAGTIGEAAARDMQASIAYQDQLPPWKTIVEDPKNAPVPDSAGACAVLVFGAVSRVDKQSLPGFMEYLKRMDTEWQAVFAVSLAKHPGKRALAFGNKEFASWVAFNQDVL
jgi:hypothetical protein